jgi:hypothetical protein
LFSHSPSLVELLAARRPFGARSRKLATSPSSAVVAGDRHRILGADLLRRFLVADHRVERLCALARSATPNRSAPAAIAGKEILAGALADRRRRSIVGPTP